MILPLFFIIAAVAFAGCRDKEDENSPPQKPSSEPLPPNSPRCPEGSEEYSLKIANDLIKVCHQDDTSKDGVFQEGEGLGLAQQDRYIPSTHGEFAKFLSDRHLPRFQGLHLSRYRDRHAQVFPQGASLPDQERFQDLDQFITQNKLSWEKILSTANAIQPAYIQTNPKAPILSSPERVDALIIAALLLSIQEDKNSFYAATPPPGEKSNRKFIDEVLNKINQSQLKIQNVMGTQQTMQGTIDEFLAFNPDTLEMRIKQNLKISNPWIRGRLIHELYHFFQGTKSVTDNAMEREAQAYRKQGEYFLSVLRQEGPVDPAAIESFIKNESERSKSNPDSLDFQALRLAYFLSSEDKARAQVAESRMLDEINARYFIIPMIKILTSEIQKEVLLVGQAIYKNSRGPGHFADGLTELGKKYQEEEKLAWEKLDKALREKTPNQKEVLLLTERIVRPWMAQYLINTTIKEIRENRFNGSTPFDISRDDPEVENFVSELSKRRVLRFMQGLAGPQEN